MKERTVKNVLRFLDLASHFLFGSFSYSNSLHCAWRAHLLLSFSCFDFVATQLYVVTGYPAHFLSGMGVCRSTQTSYEIRVSIEVADCY